MLTVLAKFQKYCGSFEIDYNEIKFSREVEIMTTFQKIVVFILVLGFIISAPFFILIYLWLYYPWKP